MLPTRFPTRLYAKHPIAALAHIHPDTHSSLNLLYEFLTQKNKLVYARFLSEITKLRHSCHKKKLYMSKNKYNMLTLYKKVKKSKAIPVTGSGGL
jgi:hypothetical protein